ncbi:MAG TPA: NAD(P)H-dependent oxidoreductase [Gaiellaceae bacterium]|nr:NAD(P)H-dependent oxidoreductase [Gaiellaceae bacterium]
MRILAISGSLRAGSHNTDLLQAAAAVAPDGVDIALYDGLKEVPPYDADDDVPGDQPASVRHFKEELEDADAVLIATPEYNSSIPGVLKNALDWASRPLAESPVRNKPVAVLSSSTGMFGGVWAAAETRKVLGALGARTLEDTVAVAKAHERLANGVDATLFDELRTVVDALATAVEARETTRAAA